MLINNVPFTVSLATIIEELRLQLTINQIPLLRVIKDTPDNIQVCCPYHKNGQERRPSAGFRKSDGLFHCFTCGEVHTLPEVISYCFGKYDDIAGVFGWQWLLKNFATISVVDRKDIPLNFERTQNVQETVYVSEKELDQYRVYHPYMWKRKLTPEVVEIFDIGYDADTKCITFPVRDITGGTLFIARRSVHTKFFHYPEGVEKPIYGLYELSLIDPYPQEVIICESMLDALTCWVYGKYGVALNGLGSESQYKALRNMPNRKFILGTDNDSRGQMARKKLRKNLPNKIITEFILPKNKKDINDLNKNEFDNLVEIF